MNAYEQKLEAKRERLLARAEKLRRESDAAYNQGKAIASHIPFGQPILVGHHSERRHRRDIDRINRAYDRAFKAHKAAGETEARAEAVGTGGISGDDPDAITKLREKLAGLEVSQCHMVEVNKAWRKAGKPKTQDDAGWLKVAELGGVEVAYLMRPRQDMTKYPWQGGPFASFSLSNNSAEIRRCKARIEELERRAKAAEEMPQVERMTVGGVRLVENRAENRMQILFPEKPACEVIANLKARGFRWARSQGAWQAHLHNRSRWQAECVVKDMGDSFVE